MPLVRFSLIPSVFLIIAAALTIEYALLPQLTGVSNAILIRDAIATRATVKAEERLSILGAQSGYSVSCEQARDLCKYVEDGNSVRPDVWLQRASFIGEYWLVRAEVPGRLLASEYRQIFVYEEVRSRKRRTLFLVWAVAVLSFFFPRLYSKNAA